MISGLPVEEWLFFITVPYASIFLHHAFVFSFPGVLLRRSAERIITVTLLIISSIIIINNYNRAYTLLSFGLMILVLVLSLADKSRIMGRFYITFIIILVPFIIMNSILTGTFIDDEVVWYNEKEIIGIRLMTIPMEDTGYGFSLIYLNLLLISRFQKIVRSYSS
jgi:lycopene cyclase domain-containing protein